MFHPLIQSNQQPPKQNHRHQTADREAKDHQQRFQTKYLIQPITATRADCDQHCCRQNLMRVTISLNDSGSTPTSTSCRVVVHGEISEIDHVRTVRVLRATPLPSQGPAESNGANCPVKERSMHVIPFPQLGRTSPSADTTMSENVVPWEASPVWVPPGLPESGNGKIVCRCKPPLPDSSSDGGNMTTVQSSRTSVPAMSCVFARSGQRRQRFICFQAYQPARCESRSQANPAIG